MGLFDKLASAGSYLMDKAEKNYETQQRKYDVAYRSEAYSSRDKSMDELKSAYNSTDSVARKAAIRDEVNRRKGK